ncbi:ACP S-malonyltransferase [Bacillus amyloliquefaciens]|uniref:ACP S-malonyltransferase n=1 Tax=Bacillus amyloliquefaciens TaxID=1390 RepID=UPI0039F6F13D
MSKIGFLFSGQGSQYAGMGKRLCDNFIIAKKTFDEASDALGFDLKKLCIDGSAAELSQTENTQPAILATSIAQFRIYMKEVGKEPEYIAGHSLGEYSALVCSDVLDFQDAVKLVRARGLLMKEAAAQGTGAMAVIRNLDERIAEEECESLSSRGKTIAVSNYNGYKDVVVSGEAAAVEELSETLKARGADIFKLNVSAAFHSPIMGFAAEKFSHELKKYDLRTPKYKVLSNVTALPYSDKQQMADILGTQIVKPVNWMGIMKYLEANHTDTVIEFGPKSVLRNLVRNNIADIKSYSYDKEEDVKIIKETLLNESVSLQAGFSIISRSLGIAVATKNYNWNNEEYAKGVIEPYEKVAAIQAELETSGRQPSREQMHMAVEMLKSVFRTKKTPIDEQKKRFNQLFSETNTKKHFEDFEV